MSICIEINYNLQCIEMYLPFYQVQILGYNADLYDNETTASKSPHGLIAISVLLQVGDMSNVEMRKITKAARTIRYGGNVLLNFKHVMTRIRIKVGP